MVYGTAAPAAESGAAPVTTRQMEWEGLLSGPGTGYSFQELGRQRRAWGGAESAGSPGLPGRAGGVVRNRRQERGLWSRAELNPWPSHVLQRSLHQPKSYFHTCEVE